MLRMILVTTRRIVTYNSDDPSIRVSQCMKQHAPIMVRFDKKKKKKKKKKKRKGKEKGRCEKKITSILEWNEKSMREQRYWLAWRSGNRAVFSRNERKKERKKGKTLKNEDLISTFYGRTIEHLDRVNTANMSK